MKTKKTTPKAKAPTTAELLASGQMVPPTGPRPRAARLIQLMADHQAGKKTGTADEWRWVASFIEFRWEQVIGMRFADVIACKSVIARTLARAAK